MSRSDHHDAPAGLAAADAGDHGSLAYALLVFTAFFWGSNAVVSRLAAEEVSPFLFTSLRLAVGTALIVAFAWGSIRTHLGSILLHWRGIAFTGTLGFMIFNALYYLAAHHTSALNIAIVQGAIPVLVLIGARIFFGSPVRLLQAAGVVVTLLGVAYVTARGHLAALAALEGNIGDLLVLGAACSYAGYTLLLRRRIPVPTGALFGAMSVAALLASLPTVAWEAAAGDIRFPGWFGWALILFVAIFPSGLAQIAFMSAVKRIGPARAGLFVNLVPVFGAVLAVILLGEAFGAYHGIGLMMVVGGILLAESHVLREALRRR